MPDCYTIQVQMCQWALQYYPACVQTHTSQVQQCTATGTSGFNQCSQQATSGYNSCSGWWKWLCLGWVWISYQFCVAWTWVVQTICLAWAWFTFTVCVVWGFLKKWVCIGFSCVVKVVCSTPLALYNWYLAISAQLFAYNQCRDPKDMPRNPLDKRDWKLTFEDDFPGSGLDPQKWGTSPWWGKPYFDAPSGQTPKIYFDSANVSVAGGMVALAADDTPKPVVDANYPGGGFIADYTAAWITWDPSYDQLHGYFEIRCKVPGVPDMFPAFWLVSRQKHPPEIDIFEIWTSDTTRFQSNLHWGNNPNHPVKPKKHPVCKASEYFHIYACAWSTSDVRWYYDNQLVRVETDGLSDLVYPMMVIVNSSIDVGNAGAPNSIYPNHLLVDYVRVYRR